MVSLYHTLVVRKIMRLTTQNADGLTQVFAKVTFIHYALIFFVGLAKINVRNPFNYLTRENRPSGGLRDYLLWARSMGVKKG